MPQLRLLDICALPARPRGMFRFRRRAPMTENPAAEANTPHPLTRTALYFLAGAVGGICNVLLTLLLLQLLGGAGYKTVGLALSASVFVIALTFEWLRFYSLRFGAEPWRLGSIYSLYWISAAALLAAAGSLALFGVRLDAEILVLLVAAIATAQAACDFLVVVARSAGNFAMLLVMQAGRGVITLAVCGATAAATRDPTATLIALVAANAGVSALTAAAFHRFLPPMSAFSSAEALQVLRFGAPLMASGLVNSLLSMSDRWLIALAGRYEDAAVGGYIGVSDIFIRALTFFAGVVVGAFIQDILVAHDRGEHSRATALYGLMTAVFAAVCAPVLVAATLLGGDVAAVLFARIAEHPSAFLLASIVAAVAAHVTRNALVETLLLLEKRTLLVLGINLGCLALACGMGWVLMPVWGMAGVPLSYMFASVLAGGLSFLIMRPETRSLLKLGAPARVALAALAAGAICAALTPAGVPSWARLAVFAALYGAALSPIAWETLRNSALGKPPAPATDT